MKLLYEDPNATDIKFRNIQKSLDWLEPPTLARVHVEELYEISKGVLDKNFSEEIKHNFSARYAEMYIAGTLIDRLSLNVFHPSDEGLDFYIKDMDCWAEIVTSTDGVAGNSNTLTETELDIATDYPEEKVILRLTNAFSSKADKARADINKGLIKPDQPIIICISGGGMSERVPMYTSGGYPQIAKAVLPIGDLMYWIDEKSRGITRREFKYRASVRKITDSGEREIKTDFFLDERYSHVSAVMYSWANAWNPLSRKNWGQDFYIIHNPLANNQLTPGSFHCGKEFMVSANETSFKMSSVVDHENI